jgi:hypothetical protein
MSLNLLITADDGYKSKLVTGKDATAAKICEDFCKLRKLMEPLSSAATVDPSNCILAYKFSTSDVPGANVQHLGSDALIADVLAANTRPNAKKNGNVDGYFAIFGFKENTSLSTINQIYSFSAKLSTMSMVFSRSLENMYNVEQDETLPTFSGVTATPSRKRARKSLGPDAAAEASADVPEQVRQRTEAYFADVQQIFAQELASIAGDTASAAALRSARGTTPRALKECTLISNRVTKTLFATFCRCFECW